LTNEATITVALDRHSPGKAHRVAPQGKQGGGVGLAQNASANGCGPRRQATKIAGGAAQIFFGTGGCAATAVDASPIPFRMKSVTCDGSRILMTFWLLESLPT